MFSLRYLLAAAAVVSATAAPYENHATYRPVNIREMMNKTVCAVREEFDRDDDRIPKQIKMLKCVKKPDQWCEENNILQEDCCNSSQNHNVMECVEMIDNVAVYKKSSGKIENLEVSVGCACIISHSTVAPSVPANR